MLTCISLKCVDTVDCITERTSPIIPKCSFGDLREIQPKLKWAVKQNQN